jgi:ferredoxin
VTGFLLEGLWLAQTHPPFAIWSPVGWVVGGFLADLGLTGGAAELAHHIVWWIHGVTALTFVASIPYTKAVHMVAAPANLTVRDPRAGKVLPPADEGGTPGGNGSEEPTGYGVLADFSWRHLLSLDACTKCGKCHAACPAVAGGYPLSPRDLVLDLREAAERAFGAHAQLRLDPAADPLAALVPGVVRTETLWSCTQCMACVEICPVGIERFEDRVEPGLFFGSVGSGRFVSVVEGVCGLRGKGFRKPLPEFGVDGFVRRVCLDNPGEILRGNPDMVQKHLVEGAVVRVFSEGPGIVGPRLVDDSFEMVDAVQPVDRASWKGFPQIHEYLL